MLTTRQVLDRQNASDVFDVFNELGIVMNFNRNHVYSGVFVKLTKSRYIERAWAVSWGSGDDQRVQGDGVRRIQGDGVRRTLSLRRSFAQFSKSKAQEDPMISQIYKEYKRSDGETLILSLRDQSLHEFKMGCYLVDQAGARFFLSLTESRPSGNRSPFVINNMYNRLLQQHVALECDSEQDSTPEVNRRALEYHQRSDSERKARYEEKAANYRLLRDGITAVTWMGVVVCIFVALPAVPVVAATGVLLNRAANGRKRHNLNCANRL